MTPGSGRHLASSSTPPCVHLEGPSQTCGHTHTSFISITQTLHITYTHTHTQIKGLQYLTHTHFVVFSGEPPELKQKTTQNTVTQCLTHKHTITSTNSPDHTECSISNGTVGLHLGSAGHLAGGVAVGLGDSGSTAGAADEGGRVSGRAGRGSGSAGGRGGGPACRG